MEKSVYGKMILVNSNALMNANGPFYDLDIKEKQCKEK